MKPFPLVLLLGLAVAATPTLAQMSGMSGAPGLKGVPDISSISPSNAAGVLSYCVKNKFLGGSDASSVIGALTGKPEVKSSDDFASGEAGKLTLGEGWTFSIDSVHGNLKKETCDMVLKQAKNFL